ncbi:MAG: DHH family phosphoesterase, partial [Deltaproteobacteria bacterium]|nr:DHH family phosphoesterase [Deltaproteobacteria bacterium]
MKIITTHKGTDFDGLASLIAGTVLYPDAIPVIPKSVNPNVKAFLSIHKELFNVHFPEDIQFDKVKQLIIVDTNTWKRLDHLKQLKSRNGIKVILWDHHPGGDIVPTWKCLEKTGATITLMIRQIQKEKKELTPILATLFLAGIYEDTGSLSFPSTTPLDAYSAAYLLEQGADLTVVNSFLKPAYNAEQKDVLFEMLRSAERTKVNRYYISCNIIEIEGHVGNLSVVVNMYRELLNVSAVFGIFFDKTRNICIVIGRSIIDEVNIGGIMRRMG